MSKAAIGRDKPWIFRTYAGHSNAADSNKLYRGNLAKGQTGLSIAFDLPTQTGYDSDHVLARGEVGIARQGSTGQLRCRGRNICQAGCRMGAEGSGCSQGDDAAAVQSWGLGREGCHHRFTFGGHEKQPSVWPPFSVCARGQDGGSFASPQS